MGKHSQFPWELLKAECLRLVCSQLVQASNESLSSFPGGGRKEDMIEFLRDVETRTLDAAVENLQSQIQSHARRKEPTSPGKRTRVAEDSADDEDAEGYNTRFKGVKRVKVREENSESPPKRTPRKSINATSTTAVKRGRGRPRKSLPEGTTSAGALSAAGETDQDAGEEGETSKAGAENAEASDAEAKDDETEANEVATPKRGRRQPRKSNVAPKPVKPKATPKPKPPPTLDTDGKPIKRGRGRPRKSVAGAAPATTSPNSKGKEVFDGVHLQKRKTDHKDEAGPNGAAADEDDGEGDEEDAVLAAVNGRDMLGDGTSSLGGSNKENDPDEAFRYTLPGEHEHDVDMDADGDPDGEAEQPVAAAAAAAATAA